VLVLGCVVIGVVAELLMKVGMSRVGRIEGADLARPLKLVRRMLREPRLPLAGALYAGGLLVWLAALSRLDLSVAVPVLGLNYALVPLAARVVLGEPVHRRRWLAIALIIVGVTIVASADVLEARVLPQLARAMG
jgi:drug/metabolite transporter (DMT)-like permease